MSMNREQKRAARRAGTVNEDGSPVSARERRAPAQQRLSQERTKPRQFIREVRGEMRKVNWPTREVVVRYSIIVLVSLIVFTLFVFGADWLFEKFFHFIINPGKRQAAESLHQGFSLMLGSY